MPEKIRVYQVAKEIGKSERETLKLLEMWQEQRGYPRGDDDKIVKSKSIVAGNRLSFSSG